LLIAMERPFKVMPHIMRFAVTFNPWSHQIARSYPSSRAKLFRAEAAMPNTYLQNLWNGRSLEQTVLRRRTEKIANPPGLIWPLPAQFQSLWGWQTP
jgi:hypothetical protein